MQRFVQYFNCGNVRVRSNKLAACDFKVTKFSDIRDIVIPFFDKNLLLGVKSKEFAEFKKVSVLMQEKAHLIPEGLQQIKRIKEGMNRGRKLNVRNYSTSSPAIVSTKTNLKLVPVAARAAGTTLALEEEYSGRLDYSRKVCLTESQLESCYYNNELD